MNFYKYLRTLLLLIITCLSLFSCNEGRKKTINHVFSLPIGYDTGELGLVNEFYNNDNKNINFHYSGGFFFISDRINNKIIKITESGQILLTIYNTNNYPQLISNQNLNNDNTTDYLIRYSSFQLYNPTFITADSTKNIYVVHSDPKIKNIRSNQVEDNVIVKFETYGNHEFTLGKTGINTEPFGYILQMINDDSNNLIVIEKVLDGFELYQFSPDGDLIITNSIKLTNIPLLKSESAYIPSFIDIKAGHITNDIYITCQFVSKENTMKLETFSIQYEKLYAYSISSGRFEKLLLKIDTEYQDLSEFRHISDISELYGDAKSIPKPFQTLIGVDKNGTMYLSQKEIALQSITANNHFIMSYKESGRLSDTKYINFPGNALYVNSFQVSSDGILLSFIVYDDHVDFINIR